MRPYCLLIATAITFWSAVSGDSVANRDRAACAYLSQKIYCYGGTSNPEQYFNDMYSLDLQNIEPMPNTELFSRWEVVNVKNNDDIEPRIQGSVIAIPGGTSMLIQGGRSSITTPLRAPTIMYDSVTNEWTPLKSPVVLNRPECYVGSATGVYVPTVHRYVYFGGVTHHSPANVTINGQLYQAWTEDIHGNELSIGYQQLTTYSMESDSWEVIPTNTTVPYGNQYISELSSVYRDDTMYFFGGHLRAGEWLENVGYGSSVEIPTVTFPDYKWGVSRCTGALPQGRNSHTTTLLSDNNTVLMFGGTTSAYKGALKDCCHLLDLNTRTWRSCNIDCNGKERYGHSAVLVGEYLFLLFGLDVDNSYANTILLLDVSNKTQIQALESYGSIRAPGHEEEGQTEKGSSGLGIGAIVGIVVGCVALLAIIIIVILWKRRANKKGSQKDSEMTTKYSNTPNTKPEVEFYEVRENYDVPIIRDSFSHIRSHKPESGLEINYRNSPVQLPSQISDYDEYIVNNRMSKLQLPHDTYPDDSQANSSSHNVDVVYQKPGEW